MVLYVRLPIARYRRGGGYRSASSRGPAGEAPNAGDGLHPSVDLLLALSSNPPVLRPASLGSTLR